MSVQPIIATRGGDLPLLKEELAAVKSRLHEIAMSPEIKRTGHTSRVAILYRDTSEKSMKRIRDHTHVMIYNVVSSMEETSSLDYSSILDLLVSTFNVDTTAHRQNMVDRCLIAKLDDDSYKQLAPGMREFLFDGNPTPEQVKEALCWLKSAVVDRESVVELELDEDFARDILIIASKHLRVLQKQLKGALVDMKPILDFTVLRFPDDSYDYFKLYRFHILMKKQTEFEYVEDYKKFGLHAQYYCMKVCSDEVETYSENTADEIAAYKTRIYKYFNIPTEDKPLQ